jgi:acyl-CoA thioester hydrolase
MEGFSFSTDVRIRFAETDAQGIAHHASFVVWLEVARVAYLERYAGGYQAIRDRGLEALTTEVDVRYHRAAYFDETLTVWARCTGLRGARFAYEYRITRGGELVADAYTRHATVDRETYRPTRVPEWLAEAIATAEGPSGA